MAYIAKWGPKAFLISAGLALPVGGISTSRTAKTEAQNSDDGVDKTTIKGLDPRTLTLTTTCIRAAGVDPQKQLTEWESLTGHVYDLYIGSVKYCKMYLDNVSTSDWKITNSGIILSMMIDLSFVEYHTSTIKLVDHKISQGDEIKRALNCTASTKDKAAKKI